MVFSEEEESQEVIVTSVEHRDPTVMSASDEQEAERRAEVPMPMKHAASADAIGEREAKWTWSPRPLVASTVPSPPATDVADQAGRSEERTSTRASMGPVLERDLQPEDAPPTIDAVEQARRFEERTGTRASRNSQP